MQVDYFDLEHMVGDRAHEPMDDCITSVPEPLTREQLLDELKLLESAMDHEQSHKKADLALLLFINDEKVSDAFMRIFKWYS